MRTIHNPETGDRLHQAPETREERARAVFDAYGGTSCSWELMGCQEWWTAAVTRFETEHVTGCCRGERLHRCLRELRPAGMVPWGKLTGTERAHWQKLAGLLKPAMRRAA